MVKKIKLTGKINQNKIPTGHKNIPKGKIFKDKKKYSRKNKKNEQI